MHPQTMLLLASSCALLIIHSEIWFSLASYFAQQRWRSKPVHQRSLVLLSAPTNVKQPLAHWLHSCSKNTTKRPLARLTSVGRLLRPAPLCFAPNKLCSGKLHEDARRQGLTQSELLLAGQGERWP